MTPAAIIQEALAGGVRLTLSAAGTIKAAGKQAAVNRWLPVIREHKPEILAVLASQAEAEDLREAFDERAGILEYDAGLPKAEAELEAAKMTATRARNRGVRLGIATGGAWVRNTKVLGGDGPWERVNTYLVGEGAMRSPSAGIKVVISVKRWYMERAHQ